MPPPYYIYGDVFKVVLEVVAEAVVVLEVAILAASGVPPRTPPCPRGTSESLAPARSFAQSRVLTMWHCPIRCILPRPYRARTLRQGLPPLVRLRHMVRRH